MQQTEIEIRETRDQHRVGGTITAPPKTAGQRNHQRTLTLESYLAAVSLVLIPC